MRSTMHLQQVVRHAASSVQPARRCRLVAPCCGTAHVCRLCHDEASDHQLDRYAVTEMICMECDTRQPVAASCSTCGTSMARYYCSICHLFDDEPGRDIYHCPFCNFCRQGKGLGVDSFHCMACNACMSLELFNRHACKEQSLQGTCPVCSDCLFESKHPIKELPCGHFMHSHCFGAYTRYSYTCPICFKSLGDMAVYWRMIDSLLAAEKLPAEYAGRKQTVLCNDCGAVGTAPFHFVYQCVLPPPLSLAGELFLGLRPGPLSSIKNHEAGRHEAADIADVARVMAAALQRAMDATQQQQQQQQQSPSPECATPANLSDVDLAACSVVPPAKRTRRAPAWMRDNVVGGEIDTAMANSGGGAGWQ